MTSEDPVLDLWRLRHIPRKESDRTHHVRSYGQSEGRILFHGIKEPSTQKLTERLHKHTINRTKNGLKDKTDSWIHLTETQKDRQIVLFKPYTFAFNPAVTLSISNRIVSL